MRMFYQAPGFIFRNAKRLRDKPTDGENILWQCLAKKQLNNFRFRRQHPVGNFIVDFYCHKAKLIVEVDGSYHFTPEQILLDQHRTKELNLHDLKVIRFTNNQIKNNIEEVLTEIKKHLP